MGRLDDAAKRKVVELRRAGLSFRKIKAVLELENIKVSAQAIYLFLKEFQGRGKPEEAGGVGGTLGAPGAAGVAGRPAGWADRQVWGAVQEAAPHPPGNAVPVETPPGGTGNSVGPSGSVAGSGAERNEEDIRIVSVTSLARGTQHGGPQAGGAGSNMGPGLNMRRKVPLAPASNPILVARKKLLDKALLHKARMRETIPQSGQQVASLLRRDPSCPLSPDVRKVTLLPQTPGFGLSPPRLPLARRGLLGQPVATVPRRPFQQKPGASVRSLPLTLQREPPPHPGIRAAHTAASPPVGQVTCSGSVRSQPPTGQPPPRKDTSPAPLKAPQELGVTGSLQEQLQTLGLELRGLGLAVRALAEQQGRLERENAQQTQVQRQILSTLQDVASRLGPGSLHHVRNPSAPPGPASYSQGQIHPVPATYGQSAPLHPEHCALDGPGLDTLEAYKLAGLSPHRMNGFPAGGSSDGLALAHTSTYTQTQTRMHTPVYTQSQTRIHTSPYTQSPTYTQSHAPTYSQSYTEVHSQTPHYPAPNVNKPLQGCSPPTQSCVNSGSPLCLSPSDPELNIIKVETL